MRKIVSLIFVVSVFFGCRAPPPSAALPVPMTYKKCADADFCTVEGLATLEWVDHIRMVELELADGRCVAVSLPEEEIALLEAGGPRTARYSGRVFPAYPDADVRMVRVNGRPVGLSSACGRFYVYVYVR